MHLLFLDDSGSAKNTSQDYFVLGGVSVPEQGIRWLSHEIDKLAEKISSNAPSSIEFHASEIFGGRASPWKKFTDKQKRISIIKNVLHTLDNAYDNVVTFSTAVHKNSFPNEDPVIKAYEDISSRFNYYLERISTDKRKELGLIILDKHSSETNLQNLAIQFRQDGNRWGSQLRRIITVPLFVDSKASRIIQLADHIAYAVFRMYNAKDINYFDCIEGRFDHNDGIIHGLAHIQKYRSQCTCPACISRRNQHVISTETT